MSIALASIMGTPTHGGSRGAPLRAAVFDLDGVLTRTAGLHFTAWRSVFDAYFEQHVYFERHVGKAGARRPFDAQDYLAHVDGRPRLEGVRAFLRSRGIDAPEGDPAGPGPDTVHGLARRKNAVFLDLVERESVEVDRAAVELVGAMRGAGIRVGVATSSRNGAAILRRAGIEDLFDARVDGVIAAELGLRGKPDPDLFRECAKRLGVPPADAVVVEDAASGVRAARAGGFGLVIAIDRGDNWLRLREAGASWIVRDSAELSLEHVLRWFGARAYARPNALAEWPRVAAALAGRPLAVFLDYDGTLAPIAPRPELAVLDEPMRHAVRRLSERWPTHIVSGRGLEDVRRLVAIDSLWYAGSHGFDIAPPGSAARKQLAPELEPRVHAAAAELRRATEAIAGSLVEDKRFSVAVHYRLVAEERVPDIERAVDETLARHPGLRKTYGKKVFELRPAFDWDKGRALLWLREAVGAGDALPVYLGDDETDEDAFTVVAEDGVGIVVLELPRPTRARYSLAGTREVRVVLERLASLERSER